MTQKLFYKIRPTYFFNLFALGIIVILILLNILYAKTQKNIIAMNHQANIEYVRSLSENLSQDIQHTVQKDFIQNIKEDAIAREYIASDLKLFVTTKYQYIYLISKSKTGKFIYLVDSNTKKGMKKMFDTLFEPMDKVHYEDVYKTKQAKYFKNSKEEGYWGTYLSPIIVHDNIEAVIVIKFSIEEQRRVFNALESLKDVFTWIFVFFVVVSLFIVWFSYIDTIREKQKNRYFHELEESNLKLSVLSMDLKTKSDEVTQLNSTLEERVQIELQKNRTKDAQLIHQSRLAQMGEMLSMIAHQWRQPLNAISAESSNLFLKSKLGKINDKVILDSTQNISQYSQHLSDTIDDFRDFFKPDKEKTETSFHAVIDSVHKLIETTLEHKNILLIKELEDEETFKSYPNELKQVILNFITNAEDALIENKIEKPFIKIHAYTKVQNCHILEVSDNAGGIDEAILDKIFDPYFSTKSKKDGTGLGLYMSKMIIQEHCKGKLNVINTKDGVMFRIILGDEGCKS